MNHREAQIQASIVEALRFVLGRHYIVAHVPNHGFTNPGILTRMGMVPGAGDMVICGNGFSGWLEVKSENGKQSPKQVQFQAECEARGIPYRVVRSIDAALDAVVAWGIAARSGDRFGAVLCLPPPGMASLGAAQDREERAGAADRSDLPGVPNEAGSASMGE